MASAAGSTTVIEPDDRLRNWFTAYIIKLEDIDKQRLNHFYWLPDEMSREYGDLLESVLREVEVDKVWMILMSVTGSQYFVDRWLRTRKIRDALFESIVEGHDDIAGTIIEYLTPDQILQFLQLQDDRGEKYLYSLWLHLGSLSLQLSKILYRLPEVSQRYEVLSIRDESGQTVLHRTAKKEILDSLESQELCFQLLSTQDNKGQTAMFTLWSLSDLKSALDSVTVEQRLTLINMRDNEGQTAAEYHHRRINDEQSDRWRSEARATLAVIEYYRREARIQIVMSTHDDDGECDNSIT